MIESANKECGPGVAPLMYSQTMYEKVNCQKGKSPECWIKDKIRLLVRKGLFIQRQKRSRLSSSYLVEIV